VLRFVQGVLGDAFYRGTLQCGIPRGRPPARARTRDTTARQKVFGPLAADPGLRRCWPLPRPNTRYLIRATDVSAMQQPPPAGHQQNIKVVLVDTPPLLLTGPSDRGVGPRPDKTWAAASGFDALPQWPRRAARCWWISVEARGISTTERPGHGGFRKAVKGQTPHTQDHRRCSTFEPNDPQKERPDRQRGTCRPNRTSSAFRHHLFSARVRHWEHAAGRQGRAR